MLLQYFLFGIGIIFFLSFICITIISVKEKKSRAAFIAFFVCIILPAPYIIVGFYDFSNNLLSLVLIILTLVVLLTLFIPFGKRKISCDDNPKSRIDERITMLSRRLLQKGTQRFNEYYNEHPSHKYADDKFRKKPGLLTKGASNYDLAMFASAETCFNFIELLYEDDDKEIDNKKEKFEPENITLYIKNWAKKLGVVDVGITELKDYHLYSFKGRNDNHGKPVERKHKYAIAFTVEMDNYMMMSAPAAPVVMESAQQYVNASVIAVMISMFIKKLGFPSSSHIDGKYDIICPLVARDAGLGEIGRMGLLITPKLGPRVRISVVTTDLPLVADKRGKDYTVIDFCERCKKCAAICPANAIPFDKQQEIDGIKRWRINQEACYNFWCSCGTDCGKCISICPYAHPDNLFHNFIRLGIENSSIFRRFAVLMDDVFYGKKPPSAKVPKWMEVKKTNTSKISG